MDNDTDFTKPNHPVNKDYLYSALQIEIMMFISLIPNVYFICLVLVNKSFAKRQILKKSILVFATLYIASGISVLVVMTNYLISYYTTGLINIELCSKLRSLQFVFTTLNSTSLLIYSIVRYILVFFQKTFLIPLMIVILFCLLNVSIIFPTIIMWLNVEVLFVKDDVCSYFKVNKKSGLIFSWMRTIDTYIIILSPVCVILINFLLLWKAKKISTNIRKNEDRAVLINLIVQSAQPLISQFPPVVYYNFGAMMGGFEPIIWNIIDGLTCLSYAFSVLLTVIFIKEIRTIVLTHFGMGRCLKVQDIMYPSITSRTVNNTRNNTNINFNTNLNNTQGRTGPESRRNVPIHKISGNIV